MDAFVTAGSGGLDAPSGLVFGPDGNLYVGSTSKNTILRSDGTTGAFIDVFVPGDSGGLTVPVGLTFGPDENLYVASAENNGNGSVKIAICHRPPGNPGKAMTISIGYLSAGDHVAHGDLVGACPAADGSERAN